jgi:hypothetical protein
MDVGSQEQRLEDWGGQCLRTDQLVMDDGNWDYSPIDIMLIPNIPEEPDLAPRQEHSYA